MPLPVQESHMFQAFSATVSGQMPTGDGSFVEISVETAGEIREAAQKRHGHFGVPTDDNSPGLNGQK